MWNSRSYCLGSRSYGHPVGQVVLQGRVRSRSYCLSGRVEHTVGQALCHTAESVG